MCEKDIFLINFFLMLFKAIEFALIKIFSLFLLYHKK